MGGGENVHGGDTFRNFGNRISGTQYLILTQKSNYYPRFLVFYKGGFETRDAICPERTRCKSDEARKSELNVSFLALPPGRVLIMGITSPEKTTL